MLQSTPAARRRITAAQPAEVPWATLMTSGLLSIAFLPFQWQDLQSLMRAGM